MKFDVERVSDGMRRDDRVLYFDLLKVCLFEDWFGVVYIRFFFGFGYRMINEFVGRFFEVEIRESEEFEKSDYEVEFRYFLRKRGIDLLLIFLKMYY